MKKGQELLPQSIHFRTLIEKDAAALYKIYADKIAMQYRGSRAMESIKDAQQFIAQQNLQEENILTIRKGVVLKNTQELIGSVMYRFNRDKEEECEKWHRIVNLVASGWH